MKSFFVVTVYTVCMMMMSSYWPGTYWCIKYELPEGNITVLKHVGGV